MICSEFIQSNIDYNNVCMVLKFINGFNCPRLFQYCIQFIDKNILKVLTCHSFLEVTEELLITIIRRDELEVKPNEEICVFQGVLSWIKQNAKLKEQNAKVGEKIFPHIRFPLMPKEDLTNIVEPSEIVDQELLMEAFKNHLVPQQSNHERFTSRLINSLKRREDSKKSASLIRLPLINKN